MREQMSISTQLLTKCPSDRVNYDQDPAQPYQLASAQAIFHLESECNLQISGSLDVHNSWSRSQVRIKTSDAQSAAGIYKPLTYRGI